MRWLLCALLLVAAPAYAQNSCENVPVFTPCDIVFDLAGADAQKHPNPYLSVNLHGEFRSPKHRTALIHGFWDGGTRMIIRFTPVEAGEWAYRLTSNIEAINGKQDKFIATESDSPGFVQPANVHHWKNTARTTPHLWMGDTNYKFVSIDYELFTRMIDRRAAQKFNHLRGLLLAEGAKAFLDGGAPDPAYFREVDRRIRYANSKNMTLDLILAGNPGQIAQLFPTWQLRERFLRYVISRYASMNLTWQLVHEFEDYKGARELLKEIGSLLQKYDSYGHPRSTGAKVTTSPLLPDGWMDHLVYHSDSDEVGSVEHQLYAIPAVNAGFAYEDSGAGRSGANQVDTDAFRRKLWNVSMNGQYPAFGNTGTLGGAVVDEKYLDSPGATQMTHWFDFFSATRYWELEPHFDVDGGRAVALPGIEYIIYIEKPSGPIEILVERHGYDIFWFNPITGERTKGKEWKGERFVAEPPDRAHDWVLHISREGRKEGMKSYKFESRQILMQEVEQNPAKLPYEIVEPSADELRMGSDIKYAVKIKRETRGTRSMMYLWTAEAASDGEGSRVVATGASGTLRIPAAIIRKLPAVLNLRITALNANGKAYALDRVYRVTQ